MEFISEFVSFMLECALWYLVISVLLIPVRRRLEAKNEELQNVVNKLNEIVHRVSVEQHNNVYYWFDADNDEFLAQGASLEDTVDHLKTRFPNHIFFVKTKDTNYKISGPDWKFVPYELK